MRFVLSLSAIWLSSFIPAFASAEEGGHHALPLHAQKIFGDLPITNSMVMTWIAALIVILFAKVATRQMKAVPTGLQNLAEWLVESLYNFLEGILGAHLVKRTFWFFGGVFILILVTNWIGLLPGVGTFGWKTVDEHGHSGFLPFLRGGNADLNMTAALSLIFTALWFYWAISENGVLGFLKHIFAPKGHFSGFMKFFMILIFFVVGVIELFSIMLRPVALSFRLFGNIFAGETMLETMMQLVPKQIAFLPALPFYFLELLVGLIQALVFMLLTSVFLKLICDHGDDHHEEAH
jgi:F-type H+-transporting ATPase subunit a